MLAGVIALAGVASSFGLALGLGAAYVFGMVAPLFITSLLWERVDWRASRLFRPRSFTWHLGPLRRTIGATDLASGLLLALMGVGMGWIGLTGEAMPTPSGWQAELTVRLQGYGQAVTNGLAWLPGWAAAAALLLLVALLGLLALRQVGWVGERREAEAMEQSEPYPGSKEERHEHGHA